MRPRGWLFFGVALLLGVAVRLQPLRFGAWPAEADPWLWLRLGGRLNAEGWGTWGAQVDGLRWGGGFDSSRNLNPAMPYVSAFALLFGFGGWMLAPVALAALQGAGVFVMARQYVRGAGSYVAAALYVLSPMVVARTQAGWLDTEAVGMLGVVWAPALVLYASRKNLSAKSLAAVCVAAASVMALSVAAWTGARFAAVPVAFVFAANTAKNRRVSRQLFAVCAACLVGYTCVALLTEKPGLDLYAWGKKVSAAAGGGFGASTVSEEQPSNVGELLVLNFAAAPLALLGLLSPRRATLRWGPLVLAVLVCVWLSLGMVRLNILLAPFLCVLAGLGAAALTGALKRRPGAANVILVSVVLSAVMFGSAAAFSAPMVLSADGGGWPLALLYVSAHPGTYAAWWDYGYWVESAGGVTLVDGQTLYAANIRDVAQLYVSSPENARIIAERWGVNFIVVTDKTVLVRPVIEGYAHASSVNSVLDAVPEWMRLVHESGGVKIYEVC